MLFGPPPEKIFSGIPNLENSPVPDEFVGCGGIAKASGNGPAGKLVSSEEPLSASVVAKVEVDLRKRIQSGFVHQQIVGWIGWA